MSEKISQASQEIIPHNVEVINSLTSEEFMNHRAEWLTSQIAGEYDGAVGHVAKLLTQAESASRAAQEAWEKGDWEEDRRLADRAKYVIGQTYKTFGSETVRQYRNCQRAQEKLGKNQLWFWDGEAAEVFEKLVETSPVVDDGLDRELVPPPTELVKPTEEDYVTYLNKKPFIPHSVLRRNITTDSPEIFLTHKGEQPYAIPIANVVSAGSMESWAGRGPNGLGDKAYIKRDGSHVTGRSIDAIMDYAERETAPPPVEEIDGFIQPDGRVIFSVPNSNHRTAAAIARGQEAIAVSGNVTFRQLQQNLI